MCIGFLLLGLLAAWRHHGVGPTTRALWGTGASLAVAALVPGLGRLVYLAVNVISGLIGFVVSHVLLAGIFYLLFTPLGWLLRLGGKDPLHLRPRHGSPAWSNRGKERDKDSYYRSF
jgi:hypothetical protein